MSDLDIIQKAIERGEAVNLNGRPYVPEEWAQHWKDECDRLRKEVERWKRDWNVAMQECDRLRDEQEHLRLLVRGVTDERNRLQWSLKNADEDNDVIRADRARLREAFVRHKDGGWTFVETFDGRWIRVSDEFARRALEGTSDE